MIYQNETAVGRGQQCIDGMRPERKFALRRDGRGSLSQAAVRSFEVVFVGVIAGRCIDFAQAGEEFAI